MGSQVPSMRSSRYLGPFSKPKIFFAPRESVSCAAAAQISSKFHTPRRSPKFRKEFREILARANPQLAIDRNVCLMFFNHSEELRHARDTTNDPASNRFRTRRFTGTPQTASCGSVHRTRRAGAIIRDRDRARTNTADGAEGGYLLTYRTRAIKGRSRIVAAPLRVHAKSHFLCVFYAIISRPKKLFLNSRRAL